MALGCCIQHISAGGAGDEGSAIALDPARNVYVTGRTRSLNFPTTAGSFEPGGGPWDAFVAKLSIVDTHVNPGTVSVDSVFLSCS
jgi:Beta-propeller repeat